MTIVEFLEARLDEDEGSATWSGTAFDGRAFECTEYTSGVLDTGDDLVAIGDSSITRHFETHDPARVLREVAAKRAIISDHRRFMAEERRRMNGWVPNEWDQPILKALASVYSDHPDYQHEWADQ
ncbi:DUF6221 family protein [Rhodococcus sp. 3-2]|uniref:DUF6221 family protein n=1 Tax=Rhodococcus sp. 3-2 TaxID=2890836 RepID=UPI001D17FD91|nr:DUF6221 family protein [Rhodococcus sp. 3-2]MCC4300401.1 DUF6221 family protein [Rhodococcus sp. 3-2]MCC4300461.1 DUF6221 family protein [Rhodococcus sp. 3-2]